MSDPSKRRSIATPRPRGQVLTICGSGNAGHALAVAASQRFEGAINWLTGSEDRAALLRERVSRDGLRSTGVILGRATRLQTISSDPADVIPEADLVLIVVPAYGHSTVLRRIGPHLHETATVGCLPTRGGFEFEVSRLLTDSASESRTIFGLQTLPWSTRVTEPGAVVHFGAAKATVALAARPNEDAGTLAATLAPILGTEVVPTDGFLNLTLGNPGQFIHPGLMYGHFRSWNGETYGRDEIPLFYADATDEMGSFVARLSAEAVAVADVIAEGSGGRIDVSGVVPILDWLRASYAHVTGDVATVATCFRTGPIQARQAPMVEVAPTRVSPNFRYRYLTEDVPFGLVVTRSIAEIVGVPTPCIDEVVAWYEQVSGAAYLAGGTLSGPDARELPLPQNHGVRSSSELISFYAAAEQAPVGSLGSASI